jgi:hypothetical protein
MDIIGYELREKDVNRQNGGIFEISRWVITSIGGFNFETARRFSKTL